MVTLRIDENTILKGIELFAKELERVVGFSREEVIFASAKDGIGTAAIMEAIASRIPSPVGDSDSVLKALIFDSKYDSYKGVVAHVRVVDGTVSSNRDLYLMQTKTSFEPIEIGVFSPD